LLFFYLKIDLSQTLFDEEKKLLFKLPKFEITLETLQEELQISSPLEVSYFNNPKGSE